ncbi:alpha/beta fold hydrolase [Plantactinospora sp. WMMB782]|uniref:alpha/beta fold hydrolase n=1 Tax=Plantactinospora sp. WMMB782 TaxID=3404121 RepID=UPI003B92C19D
MSAPLRSAPPLARVVRGSGPGLLLAHGAGGSIQANFGPVLDGLAEVHTVVGPDLPGAGHTPRSPESLDLDRLADDLVTAAVEEGLDAFAVAGFSMGTALAVRATTRHPERVTALTLTAGFARPNPRFRLAVRLWRELLAAGEIDRLAGYLSLLAVGAPALDTLAQSDLDASLSATAAATSPGTLDHLDLLDRIDVLDELAGITVPTLVISTTRDSLVTPYLHRQLADAIPGARYAEIATGHLPFVERPDEWLALQRGFLDSVR